MSEGLQVFEYGGTARSGKGTIVAWLAEVHPEVATDETGADYRSVTFGMRNDGLLEDGMSEQDVVAAVESVGYDALVDLAADRKNIEADHGKDVLYTDEIGRLVPNVAPIDVVRKAVKKGFTKRVEAVRDDNEHRILLVDGRNLAPVVSRIPRTDLVLRTFVYCMEIEAARRECLREGLDVGTEAWHRGLQKHLKQIAERNDKDKNRPNDPVKPEENHIDYWTSNSLLQQTVKQYADDLFGGDTGIALSRLTQPGRDYRDFPRKGAGHKAVLEGRQIYFDTSSFATYPNSKHAMLLAANTMFEEALDAHRLLNK